MKREYVAIVGSPRWRDETVVKNFIKTLPLGTVVLVDDDPFPVTATAMRQARCSNLVVVQHRLPTGNARKAVEARAERDEILLDGATRIVVFGELTEDREHTLSRYDVDERVQP
jgi:hypothetical protein